MMSSAAEFNKSASKLPYIPRTLFFLVLVALALLPFFYFLCLNHVSINHIGLAYDSRDGKVTVQPPGWHMTTPFVRVSAIPTLPFRVQIPSDARLVNQRLVRFNEAGALDYVKEQGFEWLTEQDFQSIMLGYAYSGKSFPFLDILEKNDASSSPSGP